MHDVLVIRNIGKDINGTCIDTNLIGRKGVWGGCEPEKEYAVGHDNFKGPLIKHVVALYLTDKNHGNAIGIGQVDIITKKIT